MSIFRRDSDRKQPSPSPEAPAPRSERPAAPARQSTPTPPSTPRPRSDGQATRISNGSRFVGEISGTAELVIDGRVEGEIDLRSRVMVGEKGRVQGKVRAETVEVAGRIQGNVIGEKRVQVLESGKLEGDVLSPRVVIAEGAFFKGKVEMTDNVPPRAGAPDSGKAKESAPEAKTAASAPGEQPKDAGPRGESGGERGGGGPDRKPGNPDDSRDGRGDRFSKNQRREPSTAGSRKG